MKITLDILDGIICGFFNVVEHTNGGLQLVSHQLSSDDFVDGNTIKLPRKQEEQHGRLIDVDILHNCYFCCLQGQAKYGVWLYVGV